MKTIYALTAVLIVSLGASWYTYKSPSVIEKQGSFKVYRATEEAINSISWEDEDQKITITKRSDGFGEFIWIEATDKIAPTEETTDAQVEENADTPAPTEIHVSFLGNAAAEKLYAEFAPLKALRSFDEIPSDSNELFGFNTPQATVSIDKELPVLITIGGSTYGSKDRYAKMDDKIFLLADATLRPLQFGKMRLVERRLHPLAEPQLTEVKIKRADGGEAAYTQHNADDPSKAYWSAADDEDNADVEATWISKLLRLRTQAYKGRRDVPKGLASIMTATLRSGATSYTFELLHDSEEDTYYAQSSYNRSMVTVTKSIAADITSDLKSLF